MTWITKNRGICSCQLQGRCEHVYHMCTERIRKALEDVCFLGPLLLIKNGEGLPSYLKALRSTWLGGCGFCWDEEFHCLHKMVWSGGDAQNIWVQKPSMEWGRRRWPRDWSTKTNRMGMMLREERKTHRMLVLALLLKASTETIPLKEVGASCALC